jgi:hypothetical protein
MGRRERERRRGARGDGARGDGARGGDAAALVARALGGSESALRALSAEWEAGAEVAAALASFLERALRVATGLGWHTTEVVRLAGKPGDGAAGLVAAVLAAGAEPLGTVVEAWAAGRPSRLEASAMALRAITLLGSLPPAPGGADAGQAARDGSGVDGAVLGRVRALLAKAESTTFPAEAEALSAKAHDLMARHAIDRALLGDQAGGSGPVATRRIWLDDPYVSAKRRLLAEVAHACGCRSVWTKGLGLLTVFGTPADLEAVEVLHTSLLVQATSAMLAAGSAVAGDHTRSRAFRSSFLLAYAGRIGERLDESRQAVVDDAVAAHGAALLPVLASREDALDAAMRAAFPRLTQGRPTRVTDAAGWHAGRDAAGRADLGRHAPVAASGAGALPGV